MGYIFISYSHKDKDYVHLLAENLEGEGFNVWIDDRLDYGSEWPNEIQQRVDFCDALILVMTPHSFKSKWVQNELHRAVRKEKPIFPLLLEGKEPWLAVEITQLIDMTNGKMPDEKLCELLSQVTPRRKPEAKSTTQATIPPPPDSAAPLIISSQEAEQSKHEKPPNEGQGKSQEPFVASQDFTADQKLIPSTQGKHKKNLITQKTFLAGTVFLLCFSSIIIFSIFGVPPLIRWWVKQLATTTVEQNASSTSPDALPQGNSQINSPVPPTRSTTKGLFPSGPTKTKTPFPTSTPLTPAPPGSLGLSTDALWPMINGGLKHWSQLAFAGPADPKFVVESQFYLIGFWPGVAVAVDGTLYTNLNCNLSLSAAGVDSSETITIHLEDPGVDTFFIHGAHTPAIDNTGTIYVGCSGGKFFAINPDGTVKWKFTTGDGVGSSAAIGQDGTTYFGGTDGMVYAVNPDGKLKWKYGGLQNVSSSPALAADGTLYVGGWDNNLYALDPQGNLKWKFASVNAIITSPLITEQGIYFSSSDGILYALSPDGNLRWSLPTGDRLEGSPALGLDGNLYLISHEPALMAISQAGKTIWTYSSSNIQELGGDNQDEGATPRVDIHGTIYIPCGKPDVCAIDPDDQFIGYYRPAEK